MNPIIAVIEFGGFSRPIGGYGMMMAIGMAVGMALLLRATWLSKGDLAATTAAMGFVAMGAFSSSWLLFVVVETLRTGSPADALGRGGLVFYGSPFGGVLALWLVRKSLYLDFRRVLDLTIPGLPVAHAMGRIGCLLGGCCFGDLWDGSWAVTYTDVMAPGAHPSEPRHPTPLYEAGVLLLIGLGFSLRPPKRLGSGERFASYFAIYAVLRFTAEFFRGDRVRGGSELLALSTSQMISVGVLCLAVSFLVRERRSRRSLEDGLV